MYEKPLQKWQFQMKNISCVLIVRKEDFIIQLLLATYKRFKLVCLL